MFTPYLDLLAQVAGDGVLVRGDGVLRHLVLASMCVRVSRLRVFCVLVYVAVLCFALASSWSTSSSKVTQSCVFAFLSLSRFARAVLRSSPFCCFLLRACVCVCLVRVLPLFLSLVPFFPHTLPLPLFVCSGESCHRSLKAPGVVSISRSFYLYNIYIFTYHISIYLSIHP